MCRCSSCCIRSWPPGAIIVADNMLQPESARPHANAYRERVRAAPGMSSVLLSVGNGLEVSRYR